MFSLITLKKELRAKGTPKKAKASEWFFKTGKGEYGYGDVFLGLTVPETRKIAGGYLDLSLSDLEKLLRCKEHEFRLATLIILIEQWKTAPEGERKKIHELYLRNTKWVNNWDLVDVSASTLVGEYLAKKDKKLLVKLSKSKLLWERRIAIIATYAYIKKGESAETFRIAALLQNDGEDLMHKAVGWMLREVGKRCGQEIEETFLKKHYKKMPRTMLRYAIERFSEQRRKAYMQGGV